MDRQQLNEALTREFGRLNIHKRLDGVCPACHGVDDLLLDFTEDMNLTIQALNALGLDFSVGRAADNLGRFWGGWVRRGDRGTVLYECVKALDSTPAALATALVEAALRVLGDDNAKTS